MARRVFITSSLLGLLALLGCDEDPLLDAPPIECLAEGASCGEPSCVGDSALSFVCRADGDGFACRAVVSACAGACRGGVCLPGGELCAEPGQACAEAVCEGGDIVSGLCDGDFRCRAVRTACGGGTVCRDGACQPESPVCEAPGQSCGAPACGGISDGIVVESVCDEALRCIERQRVCPIDAFCADGRCAREGVAQCAAAGQPCAPTPLCEGNTAVAGVCSAPGTCAEQRVDCGDALCRGGACVADLDCAVPGEPCGVPRCVGPANSVDEPVCDADLECVARVRACPRDAFCESGRCTQEGIVECRAPGEACAPAPTCEGTVAVAGVCSAPGLCVQQRFDCGEGLCRNGRCDAAVECPAPGAICAGPFCEGDSIVSGVCDDALRCRPSSVPCAEGFACDGGRCQPVSPFICNSRGEACGPTRCEGEVLVEPRCDATLTCVERRTACPDGGACVEGVCEVGACEAPGPACGAPPSCDGNVAVTRFCDNRLRCIESRIDCQEGRCRGGGCDAVFECEPGTVCAASICDGDASVIGLCTADGVCREFVTPCGADGVCQDGRCEEGPVSPDACAVPGEPCGRAACGAAGEVVEQAICDASLDCVEQERVCPEGSACDDGRCVFRLSACERPFQQCQPRRCVGNVGFGGQCDAALRCVESRIVCGPGTDCITGLCLPNAGDDCAVPGSICRPTLCEGDTRVTGICDGEGRCTPQRSPCGDGRVCDGGRCFEETPPGDCARRGNPCGAPSCRFGQIVSPVCDADLRCVEDVRDCPDDGVCQDGQCIVEDAVCARALDICVPGRCEGGVAITGVCDNGLRCIVGRRDCGDAECQFGVCLQGPECVPGTVCADPVCDGDDRVTGLCDETGVCRQARTPCGEGLVCEGGVCRAIDPDGCEAEGDVCGQRVCRGDSVISFVCDADLRCGEVAQACPEGTLCDAGACRPPEEGECATPGAECAPAACRGPDGLVRFSCDAELACAQLAEDCPAGTICDAGACRALEVGECARAGEPCGEPVCDGNTVVRPTCDGDLRCAPSLFTCPAGTECLGGDCVECVAPGEPCGPPVCDGDGVVESICGPDFSCASVARACPVGTLCDGGACVVGGGGECACSTPGATVGPAPEGCGFEDADQCSGWQSVIIGSEGGGFSPEEEAEALDRVVPDGTVFCAFDCCIRISCP